MTTLIIKNRAIVEDAWHVVRAAQDGALPAVDALPEGKVLVPLALWQRARTALTAARARAALGVWLAPDDDPADIADDFAQIALIGIDFPVFRDGRGYSAARLLRERYGYRGELRALGDVLRDQLAYLARCGFDAFAVRADRDIHDALAAFDELTVHYQGAVDEPSPLFRRRAALAGGAGTGDAGGSAGKSAGSIGVAASPGAMAAVAPTGATGTATAAGTTGTAATGAAA